MFKKILVFFFTLLFIRVSYAESDVTFQGVPWLENEVTTIQKLDDAGFIRQRDCIPSFTKDQSVYIIENDMGFFSPDRTIGTQDVCFTMDLSGFVKGTIAGCPVKNMVLTFAYDGEYKLIAIKIELVNMDYMILKNKLIKVYGESQQTITEEGIESNIWKGANNSAVLLYTQSEGLDYTFIYGRIDAIDILADCLKTDLDDICGL